MLHGVDEIVTQFEGLDPDEAGEALGALIQEFGERHSPDVVLAQFRTLLLARDPENDPAFELAAIRKGMARRAALRDRLTRGVSPRGRPERSVALRERQWVEGVDGDVRSPRSVRSIGRLDHLHDLESECG